MDNTATRRQQSRTAKTQVSDGGIYHLTQTSQVPTTREAVVLIGGAVRLAKLRTETARLATENIPTKLQLAIAIGREYFGDFSKDDIDKPMRSSLCQPFQVEDLVYKLNRDKGPWATGLSRDTLAWKPVTVADLNALVTLGDFLELIFHHLR